MSEAIASSRPDSEQLAVMATGLAYEDRAREHAAALNVPLLTTATDLSILKAPELVLCCGEQLSLQQTGAAAPGPVSVDFVGGAVGHRRRFGGGSGQQIAKAIGIQSGIRPRVLDVTAGLGRDAFVLATLGCDVSLRERSPVVALLLADGLQRAAKVPELADICARMSLQPGDGIAAMHGWQPQRDGEPPQVIYLDPMFPHRQKKAEVKKEMRLFRPLVGDDADADELLAAALALAVNRVVVKRPRKAPPLQGPTPSYALEGKSGRFDIYALKKLSTAD